MGFSLFGKGKQQAILLQQADTLIASFTLQKEELAKEKEQKMRRQIELWSLFNLSPDLENEYKEVSKTVAITVKKILCLDEHIRKLQLGVYHCKNGEFDEISGLLKVQDPCSAVATAVDNVDFSKPPDLNG